MMFVCVFFFFKQKTAYEMRISDWSSDVCSSDLADRRRYRRGKPGGDRRCGPRRDNRVVPLARHGCRDGGESRVRFGPIPVEDAEGSILAHATVATSEERRVGKECVSTCRSRGSPYP